MEGSTVSATIPGLWIGVVMNNRSSTRHDERSNGVNLLGRRTTNGKSLRQRDTHLAPEVKTHRQDAHLLKEIRGLYKNRKATGSLPPLWTKNTWC